MECVNHQDTEKKVWTNVWNYTEIKNNNYTIITTIVIKVTCNMGEETLK